MRRTASLVAMIVMVLGIMAPAATFAQDRGGNCPDGIQKLDDDPRGAYDIGDGVELTVTAESVTVTGGSVVLCVKGGPDNSGTVSLNDGETYTVGFTNPGGNTPAISNVVIYEVGGVAPMDVCPNIDGDQAEVPDGMELVDGDCVEIVVEPTDVCPNIDGDQAEVPEGMELVDGACVEVDTGPGEVEQVEVTLCHATASPTNPYVVITVDASAILNDGSVNGHGLHEDDIIPSFEYAGETFPGQNLAEGEAILAADCVVDTGPDEVDVCPNIDGDQAEVPEGMELVDGDCVEIVVEPTDVCPNLDGVQEEVPEGMELVDGECVEIVVEPTDVCPNLDGVQEEVPEGYRLVDGECALIEIRCPEGATLVDGVCVIDAVECPEGATLVDGVCVIDAVECPEGAILVGDVCVIDAVECPEGAELVDGVCVADVVCPEGSTLTDGECVVDTVVGGVVVDRPDDGDDGDDGDVDGEEVVVVVPSDVDTEVLGVTQTRTRTGTAQLAATGPATLPLLALFSLLSLLFGLQLRSYGRTARASK